MLGTLAGSRNIKTKAVRAHVKLIAYYSRYTVIIIQHDDTIREGQRTGT